jgi:hypothetical protein
VLALRECVHCTTPSDGQRRGNTPPSTSLDNLLQYYIFTKPRCTRMKMTIRIRVIAPVIVVLTIVSCLWRIPNTEQKLKTIAITQQQQQQQRQKNSLRRGSTIKQRRHTRKTRKRGDHHSLNYSPRFLNRVKKKKKRKTSKQAISRTKKEGKRKPKQAPRVRCLDDRLKEQGNHQADNEDNHKQHAQLERAG